jgi:beta-glucosidase
VGQQPVHYNRYSGWHSMNDKAMAGQERYIDMPEEALFVFGEGMSYTSFSYSNLTLSSSRLTRGLDLLVSIDLRNRGDRDGTEIIQLYINDLYSSVTTPVKEIRGFERVFVKAGETVCVSMTLPFEELSLVNAHLERVVEPGEFEILVGSSSRDGDLLKAVVTVE